MAQSCSTPLASPTPRAMCISTRVKRGTSCACVQMGLCSVSRWSTPTWAARHQTTPVEQLFKRLEQHQLLDYPAISHNRALLNHLCIKTIGHPTWLQHNVSIIQSQIFFLIFVLFCLSHRDCIVLFLLGQRYTSAWVFCCFIHVADCIWDRLNYHSLFD